MDSQFSLSLELAQITPPVLEHGRQVLVETVKAIQKSGSNYLTETQLAAVFGRTLIQPQFADKFRRLVGTPGVYNFNSLLRLVLESGPGPTIKYAFERGNDAYLSMVVHMSLFAFVYSEKSLTDALSNALEDMTSKEAPDVPRSDTLRGTIRSITEQACGFNWEIWLASIEATLDKKLKWSYPGEWKGLPYTILAGLIKVLPLVYRFPESYILDVKSRPGTSFLVLWAYELLGLSVEVKYEDERILFGERPASVFIDAGPSEKPDVVLLKESNDARPIEWSRSDDHLWIPFLAAANRHTLKGFGAKCIRMHHRSHWLEQLDLQRAANEVAKVSCHAAFSLLNTNIPRYCLTRQRVLSTIGMLFPSTSIPDELTSTWTDEYLMKWSDSVRLNNVNPFEADSWIYTTMSKITVALCAITDLEACQDAMLSLDEYTSLKMVCNMDIESMTNALRILQVLVGSYDYTSESFRNSIYTEAAIVSGWGWSLCVSSFMGGDPSHLCPTIHLIKGVPARSGERKSYVSDHSSSFHITQASIEEEYRILSSGNHTHPASLPLRSCLTLSEAKYMIGASVDTFTVLRTATLESSNGGSLSFRIGMRWMQEIFWNVYHLPTCECAKRPRLGDLFYPSSNCWVFGGILGPAGTKILLNSDGKLVEASEDPWELATNPPGYNRGLAAKLERAKYTPDQLQEQRVKLNASLPHRDPECRIHLGLTAGDGMARWFLLSQSLYQDRRETQARRYFNGWYLRHSDCCIECGVKTIRQQIQGDNVAYAHAGMIL